MDLNVSIFNRFCLVVEKGRLNGSERRGVFCEVFSERVAETSTKDGEELGDRKLAFSVNLYKNSTVGFRVDFDPYTADRDNFSPEVRLSSNKL